MNLYLTFEDKSKIKKCFLNLRKYLIISIDEIIEKFGFDKDNLDNCHAFIINEELLRLVKDGSSGRKLLSIVYSNPRMDDDIIRSMIHHVETLKNIEKVIFLVEKGKQEEYYELFEEVLFFPTLKKVHIIECQPLPIIWLDRQEEFENLKNSN